MSSLSVWQWAGSPSIRSHGAALGFPNTFRPTSVSYLGFQLHRQSTPTAHHLVRVTFSHFSKEKAGHQQNHFWTQQTCSKNVSKAIIIPSYFDGFCHPFRSILVNLRMVWNATHIQSGASLWTVAESLAVIFFLTNA